VDVTALGDLDTIAAVLPTIAAIDDNGNPHSLYDSAATALVLHHTS
jgi:hypothetical protein